MTPKRRPPVAEAPPASPRRRRSEAVPAPEPPPPTPPPRRLASGFSTIRDIVTFGLGVGIIGYEVFVTGKVDPTAIAVGVSLTGLPLVFGADDRRKSGGS